MALRSDTDDYRQVAFWRAEDALQRIPPEPEEITSARRRTLELDLRQHRLSACPTCGRQR